MTNAFRPVVLCVLVVAAGCLGPAGVATPATDTPTEPPSATSTPGQTPTQTAPVTPPVSDEVAGERAVAAEQARIERIAAGNDTLTGLSFGILRPDEFEVVDRNRTAVIVRVTVGYSVSFDCDGDGEPESSADGAYTEATYLVTETETELRAVSQGFLPSGGHC
ncbi:hypothetical protein [Halobaculum gomorrense]|uniref:Uncharacterized protein n=1 Tax=Halobaculum gomorrense TaxID=43928 RepID=A0A1M5TRP6_9EURY|nr:hypothetical protein [Halobaculum gomorrense]SHH53073.1 hypothetical protein SAMN05443636_2806 [Halobaculum gomorrense]